MSTFESINNIKNIFSGVNVSTYKPNVYKTTTPQIPSLDNNLKKKFAFLSTETIPDYRPKEIIPQKEVQLQNEKNQKTTNNQTTKFHQLQKMFGNICNEPNNDYVPFHKQHLNNKEDNSNDVSI